MTINYAEISTDQGGKADRCWAFKLGTSGGLAVRYIGAVDILLEKVSVEDAIRAITDPKYQWVAPCHYGEMLTGLTIAVESPRTMLIFILDEGLNAVFSQTLPALFASDERGARAFGGLRIWKDQAGTANVVSVITQLEEPGVYGLNIGLDALSFIVSTDQQMKTPIAIDPDLPWPPTGGGIPDEKFPKEWP